MSQNKDKRRVDAITILIAVGAALATGAAGYGVAWFQGESKLADGERTASEQRTELQNELRGVKRASSKALENARADAEREASALREERDDSRQRVKLLEARRQLGLVLNSMDDRNFGIAQRHLDRSKALLDDVEGPSEELRALSKALGDAPVVVAGNLQKQRAAFRSQVDRLDELIELPGSVVAKAPPRQPNGDATDEGGEQ